MQSLDHQLGAYRAFSAYTKNKLPLDEAAKTCAEDDSEHREAWLAAAQLLARGTRLSDAINGTKLWPEVSVRAVAAAERSQKLPEVFAVLVTMAENRRKVAALLKKNLIKPAAFMVISTGLLFAALLVFFPLMSKTIEKRTGPIAVMDAAHGVAQVGLVPIVLVLLALAAWLTYAINSESGRNTLLRLLDRNRLWGRGFCYVSLSYWCSMVDLMHSAGDIHDDEIIDLANRSIPPVHAEAFGLLLEQSAGEGTMHRSLDKTLWAPDDPRHKWPSLFRVALRGSVATGDLGTAVAPLSKDLLDAGLVYLEKAITVLAAIGTALTGLALLVLMLIYTMTVVAQVMNVF